MTRAEVVDLIVACIPDFQPSGGGATPVDESTVIFGRDGAFDSMQLVQLLIELEQRVNESCGTTIALADERAMSQERSPFRRVASLADYVTMLIAEQKARPGSR